MPAGISGTTANGNELQVDFRYSGQGEVDVEGGKEQISRIIRGLLDADVQRFAVTRDLDDDSPEQVVLAINDVVTNHLGANDVNLNRETNQILLPMGAITVIPIGLYEDGALGQLGITKHELEDLLIRLLLEDASLRENVPELGTLLAQVLSEIRRFEGPFNSGKEVFQLIKPIVQHGISDTGAIRRIIRTGNEDLLRTVLAPLLESLEHVLIPGLQ